MSPARAARGNSIRAVRRRANGTHGLRRWMAERPGDLVPDRSVVTVDTDACGLHQLVAYLDDGTCCLISVECLGELRDEDPAAPVRFPGQCTAHGIWECPEVDLVIGRAAWTINLDGIAMATTFDTAPEAIAFVAYQRAAGDETHLFTGEDLWP